MRPIVLGRPTVTAPAGDPRTTPVQASAPEPTTHHVGPNLTPLIVALLALTALIAVPWGVSHRLARVRHDLVGTTARGRRLVHQAEAAMLLDVAAP